jgi:hypothetical protein
LPLPVAAGHKSPGHREEGEPRRRRQTARRRVPLGADEETVVRAGGQRPDGRVGLAGKTAEVTRFALFWERGDDQLNVVFDEDGRAVRAEVYRWEPTRWDRFRAWLGL